MLGGWGTGCPTLVHCFSSVAIGNYVELKATLGRLACQRREIKLLITYVVALYKAAAFALPRDSSLKIQHANYSLLANFAASFKGVTFFWPKGLACHTGPLR